MNTLLPDTAGIICSFLKPTDVKNFNEVCPGLIDWEYYRFRYLVKFMNIYMQNARYTKANTCYKKSAYPYKLLELLKNNTYSFDTFWSDYSLKNVRVPSCIWDQGFTRGKPICISRNADIAKGFLVRGQNIRKISLLVGGQRVWAKKYFGTEFEWIQPFKSGVILFLLQYHQVRIDIEADHIESLKIKGIVLNETDRHRLLRRQITVPYIDPTWPFPGGRLQGNEFRYNSGMGYKRYA